MGEAKKNLENKKKEFDKDPNMFISLKDLVIGVSLKVEEDGKGTPGILINPSASRGLIVSALFDINQNIKQYITHMDMESAKAKESPIITPGGKNGKNRMGDIT